MLGSGRLKNVMIQNDGNGIMDAEKKDLLEALGGQLAKSKAELVTEIETEVSKRLGIDVRQAFSAVAAAQQIRGGAMNLDRTHKSMLVLLAHVLSQKSGKSELLGK